MERHHPAHSRFAGPVVIYISPRGSRGAFRRIFILMSADVGGDGAGNAYRSGVPLLAIGGVPLQVDDTLKKKILNDATAFLRSYSQSRGATWSSQNRPSPKERRGPETEALDGKLVN